MNLTPFGYLVLFFIGTVFQAGGFYYVTRANSQRMKAFEEKLGETREDVAWIKGRMTGTRNGGKKR